MGIIEKLTSKKTGKIGKENLGTTIKFDYQNYSGTIVYNKADKAAKIATKDIRLINC